MLNICATRTRAGLNGATSGALNRVARFTCFCSYHRFANVDVSMHAFKTEVIAATPLIFALDIPPIFAALLLYLLKVYNICFAPPPMFPAFFIYDNSSDRHVSRSFQ